MTWIKKWLVKLLAPKFVKDKVGQVLTIIATYLATKGWLLPEDVQTFIGINTAWIANAVVYFLVVFLGVGLNISATEKGQSI